MVEVVDTTVLETVGFIRASSSLASAPKKESKMYIKFKKIKELAEKIEKETLNNCEVKYEGNEDERIEIWTKTYECFSYTSERGLIFEMQDGYLTEKEIEYLFNEYKKIKEVIQNFLEQKEK